MVLTDNKLVVIIPAYEPQPDFIEYALKVSPLVAHLVVVNDGSSEAYDDVFGKISMLPNCTYLKHDINRGKGCALKTAFDYCIKNFSRDAILVTADCDGQHAIEDVLRVYEAALANKNSLVLGSRDFTKDNIPPKSQFGNSLFRVAYRVVYGLAIYDTQTGLRGFSIPLAEVFLSLPGDRFEYEMTMLICAKQDKIPILEVPIQTIYQKPEERITHYKAFRDTAIIMHTVIKNARKIKKSKTK